MIWETAAGGKDKEGTLEITDYSMFSGSAVFVVLLRSDESPVSLGKGTAPIVKISAASHLRMKLNQTPT